MELDRRFLWIAAIPVLIYIGTDELFYSLANPMPPSPQMDLTVSPTFEAARRIRFLASLTIYLSLSGLTVGLLISELFTPGRYSARTRRDVSVTFCVTVVAGLLYGLSTIDERFYAYIAQDLYEAVVRVCAQGPDADTSCLFGAARDTGMPTGFDFTLRLGAGAALVSLVAMALGSALALADKHPESAEEAMRLPKLFLYISSACFTMAMVSLLSWVNMVVPYLSGDGAKAEFAAIRDAATLYYGVCYSLMILGAYIPVVAIINARLADGGVTGAGGAKITRQTSIKEALAFAAPILTALVSSAGSEVVTSLSSAF